MSGISTHVLDTAKGLPALGVQVVLERQSAGSWMEVGRGVTDNNGRIAQLLDGAEFVAATYRLTFFTGDYFQGQDFFYPQVIVLFDIRDRDRHHHVPLLLSPYGYTTYRGS